MALPPVCYWPVFSDHSRLDCLSIKEHKACINTDVQTCFIMDVTSEGIHAITSGSFLAGYAAAFVTNTEHIMSCSSAPGPAAPPTFQLWNNLQFKLSSICSTRGKCTKNELYSSHWSVREELFSCRFLAPPSRCPLGHFQKQTIHRVLVMCSTPSLSVELAVGDTSIYQVSQASKEQSYLAHERVNSSHIWRWKIKKPYIDNSEFGEFESKGPFTYALAATYSQREDSSNQTMWMKLLGKATERD